MRPRGRRRRASGPGRPPRSGSATSGRRSARCAPQPRELSAAVRPGPVGGRSGAVDGIAVDDRPDGARRAGCARSEVRTSSGFSPPPRSRIRPYWKMAMANGTIDSLNQVAPSRAGRARLEGPQAVGDEHDAGGHGSGGSAGTRACRRRAWRARRRPGRRGRAARPRACRSTTSRAPKLVTMKNHSEMGRSVAAAPAMARSTKPAATATMSSTGWRLSQNE